MFRLKRICWMKLRCINFICFNFKPMFRLKRIYWMKIRCINFICSNFKPMFRLIFNINVSCLFQTYIVPNVLTLYTHLLYMVKRNKVVKTPDCIIYESKRDRIGGTAWQSECIVTVNHVQTFQFVHLYTIYKIMC
jgi:hypothetical protein